MTAIRLDAYSYCPDQNVSRCSVFGSSTFLTDAVGLPYQFLIYPAKAGLRFYIFINNTLSLPFGETMAEQNAGQPEGWATPYKFSAKEQDDLTGYYYYGARYYSLSRHGGNPRVGIFHGVDPLADMRPGHTPYNYVQNNPITRIDPDGALDTDYLNSETGETVHIEDGKDQIAILNNNQFKQVKQLASATSWNQQQTEQYENLTNNNVLDFNSDLGLLTRVAFAEFTNQGLDAKMIAVESVLNRIEYNQTNGAYTKYSPDLKAATSVENTILAPNGYAQTPKKEPYLNPYSYVKKSEKRNEKGARASLLQSAYAAYKVSNNLSPSTGVIYYHSHKNLPDDHKYNFKSWASYKKGDLQLLKLNINGISQAAKFKR